MKKTTVTVVQALLLTVVIAAVVYWANYAFNHSAGFRSLFSGVDSAGAVFGKVAPDSAASLAMRDELAGRISMFIFVGISLLQFTALFIAAKVIGRIRDSEYSLNVKLKQLDNADIFLDVPLYIGLFGTVSSFLVMTFSPTSSRLIAYSSTMIGIIFSLILRLSLNYPLRRKLIAQKCENDK